MFWSSKKKIPAPQHERYALAKQLYLFRLSHDPSLEMVARSMGADPADFTGEEIFRRGFPEVFVIVMVEQFYDLSGKGLDHNGIVQTISGHFGRTALGDGTYPPEVPVGTGFVTYLRLFVDAVTRGGAQVSNDILVGQVDMVKTFYKR